MAEDGSVLDSWEELDDKEVLNKQLEGIKVTENAPSEERNSSPNLLLEEGNRTQYTPQVKILKRQTDQGLGDSKNKGNKGPQKTLQQREAEYKEARLRILGAPMATEDSNNLAANFSAENRPIRLVKQVDDLKQQQAENSVTILRDPKGPDGTAGFSQNR